MPTISSSLPPPERRIRLFVVDIDGCLTPGGSLPFNLRALEYVREINFLAPRFEAVPEITFLTGRPQAYMEAMMQAIACRMPGLSENGAMMFRLPDRMERFHPALPENVLELLGELATRVRHEMLHDDDCIELGKTASFGVIPGRHRASGAMLGVARRINDSLGAPFLVEDSSGMIHFLFRGVDKGSSVDWLAQTTGIAPEEMAGIGDALLDVPFLKRMGLSAAPEQAPEYVREAVHWRAPGGPGLCVAATLDLLIERNLSLAPASADASELRVALRDIRNAVLG